MRNSCKAGGTAKKKYQSGGGTTTPPKKVLMSPAKIAVGPLKPATAKEKEEALKKFKAAMEKEVGKAPFPAAPKKKYEAGGGVIPAKPVMTAPMQGRLGNRPIAGGNMAKGGSLKPVNPSANPGLAKLPTAVRNKMGYAKRGGAKYQDGGNTGTPPMSTKEALGKVFQGKMTADQAKAATGSVSKPNMTPQEAAQFRATLKEKMNAKSTMKGGAKKK